MVAAYNAWEDAKAQVRLTKAQCLHDYPLIGKALSPKMQRRENQGH